MQTFLPYPDFEMSALALDWRRLGKQRVESWQILRILIGAQTSSGWKNHPAVRMWREHSEALSLYGQTMCREWIRRGYRDTMLPRFIELLPTTSPNMPRWMGDQRFHDSHCSNLIRKMPEHYSAFWPDISGDLPYVWPE